ncbi:MAG: winged helix-turn-helix transcriptional regulator, partial [Clostridiales bacterium]|nr:winged helix-turn-helix transcriptional regulator [Clostridiales bacterium]
KGQTRAVFVDRREFDGWLPDQIEQAYQFVLRNIHLGAVFEGIYRKDVYEIPPDAIRELIINAVIHRSYIDHGNIQVAIYDNRLEVTSPGKLAMGQTIDQMKSGHSKIRNEALAHAFYYMNLIEHWGSGIPRIIEEVTEAGLREPEFLGGDTDLAINIYRRNSDGGTDDVSEEVRNNFGITSEEVRDNFGINLENGKEKSIGNATQLKILELLSKNPHATSGELAEQVHLSERGIELNIKKLKDKGILIRRGAKKGGYWEIEDGYQKKS